MMHSGDDQPIGVRPQEGGVRPREGAVLVALLLIAAVVRFMGLPARGMWDADQGHDMLVLLGLLRDGSLPLLGPPTSIGTFHHGALYYYLLAPAAFVSGADPTWVVAEIALAGVAAVALTWWLARAIGGTVAGIIAGLLMTVSASAVEESTFIWNPNLIAFSSVVALAAAWRGWTTGRARWWLLAALGVLITMQCHVLGIALLPPVGGLLVVQWRRTAAGPERRRLGWTIVGSAAIVLAGYVPLAAYELGHDFAETRAGLAFIMSGGSGVGVTLPARLLFVALRILSWPLTGLLTNGLLIGTLAGILAAAGLAWRAGAAQGRERDAARWLGVTLVFGWLVLTFGAAGLSTVTPLPVDHYHAFLDPVVFVSVGITLAAVLREARAPSAQEGSPEVEARRRSGRTLPGWLRLGVLGSIGILVAWNVATWPPAVADDGGWPAVRASGDRIESSVATGAFASLPSFKLPDAYAFPLARDGRSISVPLSEASALVIVCDSLFVRDCAGPAEDAYLAAQGLAAPTPGSTSTPGAASPPAAAPEAPTSRLVDRWLAAPGRTLSVYLLGR